MHTKAVTVALLALVVASDAAPVANSDRVSLSYARSNLYQVSGRDLAVPDHLIGSRCNPGGPCSGEIISRSSDDNQTSDPPNESVSHSGSAAQSSISKPPSPEPVAKTTHGQQEVTDETGNEEMDDDCEELPAETGSGEPSVPQVPQVPPPTKPQSHTTVSAPNPHPSITDKPGTSHTSDNSTSPPPFWLIFNPPKSGDQSWLAVTLFKMFGGIF